MIRHITLRLSLCALGAVVTGCSAYERTVGAVFEAPGQAAAVPHVDLTNAKWQKLAPQQPDSNPVRVAIVANDQTIGATRVVIKAPAGFALPAYWLASRGTYTVLKGTFVFEGVDAKGRPERLVQEPGAFALIPPNLIQKAETKPGDEGLLYVTVYGEWAPHFLQDAWTVSLRQAQN